MPGSDLIPQGPQTPAPWDHGAAQAVNGGLFAVALGGWTALGATYGGMLMAALVFSMCVPILGWFIIAPCVLMLMLMLGTIWVMGACLILTAWGVSATIIGVRRLRRP